MSQMAAAVGDRESQAQRAGARPGVFDQRVKKETNLGEGRGGWWSQKRAVMELVEPDWGRRISENGLTKKSILSEVLDIVESHMRVQLPTTDVILSEMEWETNLLGRRIARIENVDSVSSVVAGTRALRGVDQRAKEAGYELLVSRVGSIPSPGFWSLELAGFKLVDVGVVFDRELRPEADSHLCDIDGMPVREATIDDLATLQIMSEGLFVNSYYYTSQFFSRTEADLLHRQWISNCVNGVRGERVLVAGAKDIFGFVTLRAPGNGIGVIDLIGVEKRMSGRRIGSALLTAAIKSFIVMGQSGVRVRTQLTNVRAVNLYVSKGFYLTRSDATLMKPVSANKTHHN